jgi:hypothetical protein
MLLNVPSCVSSGVISTCVFGGMADVTSDKGLVWAEERRRMLGGRWGWKRAVSGLWFPRQGAGAGNVLVLCNYGGRPLILERAL